MDQSIEPRRAGISYCHYCNKMLQLKPIAKRREGEEKEPYFYKIVLTPHDGYPVRVHVECAKKALEDGWTEAKNV